MLGQVRLVPDLVVVDLIAVASGEFTGEGGEALGVIGGIGRAVVEHGHQSQLRVILKRLHDAVGDGPIGRMGHIGPADLAVVFDLAPVEGLAYPDEAALGDAIQRGVELLLVILLQRDVDAQSGHVGLGHGRRKIAWHAADARSVALDDGPRAHSDHEQQNAPHASPNHRTRL